MSITSSYQKNHTFDIIKFGKNKKKTMREKKILKIVSLILWKETIVQQQQSED